MQSRDGSGINRGKRKKLRADLARETKRNINARDPLQEGKNSTSVVNTGRAFTSKTVDGGRNAKARWATKEYQDTDLGAEGGQLGYLRAR